MKNFKQFYRRMMVENILADDGNALQIKLDLLQASSICQKGN